MKSATFNWIGSLISVVTGALGGALSGALGPMLSDAKDFNFDVGLHKALVSAAIGSGITTTIAFLNFLQKSPLPGWSSTTTTEIREPHSTVVTTKADGEVVEERSPHATTVTTVAEAVAPPPTVPPVA